MKLLTKKLEMELLVDQSEVADPIVKCHWFNPVGRGDWFGIQFTDINHDIVFGYVSLFGDHNDELGDFSLAELENVTLPMGMKIERDLHWTPTLLSAVKGRYTV
jgi:hypothetical protein